MEESPCEASHTTQVFDFQERDFLGIGVQERFFKMYYSCEVENNQWRVQCTWKSSACSGSSLMVP